VGRVLHLRPDRRRAAAGVDEDGAMTLRLGALHDALLDPGNAAKAQAAAEEVAGYEHRLASIETRLASLERSVMLLMGLALLQLSLVVGLYFKP
jgi:hypothetical protein